MTDGALLGALATAGVLGVTHAVEPDHVAGIASLTSRYGDSRLSALVGACFSLGHVALVVVWLSLGFLVLQRTAFPPVFDTIGTIGVSLMLGVLGATLLFGGLKRVAYAHSHEHTHGGTGHRHAHAHLPFLGGDSGDGGRDSDSSEASDSRRPDATGHGVHDHEHTVGAYLKTGVIGALFTLSPPISMIVFASSLLSTGSGETVVLAVAAYTVGITVTMSALGAGAGALFGVAGTLNVRVYGGAQALAGVLVVGLAASLFGGVVW